MRPIHLSIVMLLLALTSTALRADERPPDAIADDVDVVIRLKNPQSLIAKSTELAELVQKGLGDRIQIHVKSLGELILNPKFTGVDMQCDWWLAVYASGGDRLPGMVFVIPATDTTLMQQALGDEIRIMKFGTYAAYSSDARASKKTAARLSGEGKSVSSAIDDDCGKLFDSGDLAVFINVTHLATTYKPEIDEKKRESQRRKEAVERLGGTDAAANREEQSFDVGGMDDIQSATFAANVSNRAIELRGAVRVTPGSPTAMMLPESVQPLLPELRALPHGASLYAGASRKFLDRFGVTSPPCPIDVKELVGLRHELVAAVAELRKAKLDTIVYCAGLTERPEFGETWIARSVEPENLRKNLRNVAVLANSAKTRNFDWGVKISKEREFYGTLAADVITWNRFLVKNSDTGLRNLEWTSRTVALNDRVIQTTGGGRQGMQKALSALQQEKAEDTSDLEFERTLHRLDPQAGFVVLVDLPRLLVDARAVLIQVVKAIVEQALWPLFLFGKPDRQNATEDEAAFTQLRAAVSYAGLSVAAQPHLGMGLRVYIPLEQVRGMVRFFQILKSRAPEQ